ncbi:hypothetical protein IOK49_04130 [Fervidicoccus fontis]|nr:hypothetical protein [Fervidicoccus fontis]MBE9391260.1 hypothetical protein [Fervidicoccus fontis]
MDSSFIRGSKKMRASSELISTVILIAAVLAMSSGLWYYAQDFSSNLSNNQYISSEISQSAMSLNLLKVYSDPSSSNLVYQVGYVQGSTIYLAVLTIQKNSFIYLGQEQISEPSQGLGFFNLSDPSEWTSLPVIQVQSSQVMVQPIYSSDSSYYPLSLWLGSNGINLYPLYFNTSSVQLLNIKVNSNYDNVMVFFTYLNGKYWAFSYFYV